MRQEAKGDAAAGHQFVRDYYPDVYHYLLYLTGRPEMAEDLAHFGLRTSTEVGIIEPAGDCNPIEPQEASR